jgi:hypothetical protein
MNREQKHKERLLKAANHDKLEKQIEVMATRYQIAFYALLAIWMREGGQVNISPEDYNRARKVIQDHGLPVPLIDLREEWLIIGFPDELKTMPPTEKAGMHIGSLIPQKKIAELPKE